MTPAAANRRDRSVTRELVAAVDAAVRGHNISHAEAFRLIAARTGRKAPSVSTTYYAAVLGPRSPAARRRKSRGADQVTDAVERVRGALDDLRSIVSAQEAKLTELRRSTADLEEFRRVIARL